MFEKLKKRIESELVELKEHGAISVATRINETFLNRKIDDSANLDRLMHLLKTKDFDLEMFALLKYFEFDKLRKNLFYQSQLPLYFTGDLYSDTVYVGLNPRPGNLSFDSKNGYIYFKGTEKFYENAITDFDSYIQYALNFASCKSQKHYKGKKTVPKNKFDGKQLAFFAGFDGNEFPDYSIEELVRLRSNRLQLELIPYASLEFKFPIHKEYLTEQIENIFDIINEQDRKIVLFSGKVLDILKSVYTDNEICVVPNSDSSITKNKLNFPILQHPLCNCKIGIVQSFPNQSLQGEKMYRYGKWCRNIYNNFE